MIKSFKQKIIESILNEEEKRKWERDPHNFGINQNAIPAGSFVSHGDIFDKSDVIWHHTNMLRYALQANDQRDIERNVNALKNAGVDPDPIIAELRRKMNPENPQ